LLAALPAQPPSPQAIASSAAAIAARVAVDRLRNKIADASLIASTAISLKSVNV